MRKTIFSIIFVTALALPALAQSSGYIGFNIPVAENGGNPADDLGVNFGGKYEWKNLAYFGLDSFVNDGFGSRHRFGGGALFSVGEHKFGAGGGYFCAVRCGDGAISTDGGFGELRYSFQRFHGLGRIGNDRFLEGEFALDAAKIGRVGLQLYGRATRHEIPNTNLTQTIYPVGVRLTFTEKEK